LFRHLVLTTLEEHERLCTPEIVACVKAAVDAQAVEPSVKCPYDGCKYAPKPDTARGPEHALKRHIADEHKWGPRVCPYGCDPETSYATKSKYKAYREKEHKDGWPRACSHADCSSSPPIYATRSSLKTHLEKKHKVFGNDLEAFMPTSAKPPNGNVGKRQVTTRTVMHALGSNEADNSGYATSDEVVSKKMRPNAPAANK